MASTVYKGDLAEVTLSHETGIVLSKGAFGGLTWSATTGAGGSGNDSTDTTRISFSGSTAGFFDSDGYLKYPVGALAGCRLRIKSSTTDWETYDYNKGSLFTIVSNGIGADGVIDASSLKEIVVTPAITGASSLAAGTGDELYIDALGAPTIDPGMKSDAAAHNSDERVLADQFVGLAATITLPETKVEILRSHVVGIGRQVVVQEPQSISNEGGSLETMMHSARWLYYALGNEAIKSPTTVEGTLGTLANGIGMGDCYVSFADSISDITNVIVGDYVVVVDGDEVLTPYAQEPTSRTKWTGAQTQFHSSERNEIRRVIAVDNTAGFKRIYIDDPFCFDHASGKTIKYLACDDAASNGSPNFDTTPATFGTITNIQSRAMWSMWHQPSFSIETSIRNRNVGSSTTDELDSSANTSHLPGNPADSKQLTRLFKGCKINSWELNADADAEVKLKVDFDALMCYTDTGRLEDASAATTTLVALSKTAGEANTRILTLSDGANTVNFTINNSTATSTATVIGYSNANSNATQFATNIAAAVNAAKTAGTLNMSASASSANVTLTQDNTGGAGNTTPSGTAISDTVITSSTFTGGNNPGDRYTAHRMFENIANGPKERKVSGIAPNTEKPFFFYNGTITAFGSNLAQVTKFKVSGSNNIATHRVIGTNPNIEPRNAAGSSLEQIPFAGSRNPTLSVEGAVEYECDMEILVSDPLLWHEFRTNRAKGYSEPITLHLVKGGAGVNREEVRIIIDDYIIAEAPLPIPEDKGVIRSELKIKPRHVKVVAYDTLLHS